MAVHAEPIKNLRFSLGHKIYSSLTQENIVTDAKTGHEIDSLGARAGARFRADSHLLIINAEPYCITTDICDPEYYRMEKGKLIRLN